MQKARKKWLSVLDAGRVGFLAIRGNVQFSGQTGGPRLRSKRRRNGEAARKSRSVCYRYAKTPGKTAVWFGNLTPGRAAELE